MNTKEELQEKISAIEERMALPDFWADKDVAQATIKELQKFKDEHLSLFKGNSSWTLDQHRKRLIDWLPQNI